ncbi:MAG: extracellular solute-binding protein [Clostridiales bacterium]|nr:extracellular solute-binding protein [Clostridiales bacterium]
MKKLISLLLALCVLLPAAALAGDGRKPMLLLGVDYYNPKVKEPTFWKRHPEIPIEDCFYFAFDDWSKLIPEKKPDLVEFDCGQFNFYQFRETGVLADLSVSEVIREATERLRPDIKALVTTVDGRILAAPLRAWSYPLMWNQEAWDAAGYTEADVPQTYPELLDFLESWIERIKKNPVKNVSAACVTNYAEIDLYRDVGWLIALLIETWEMQCAYAGEPLNFDTPEFIDLLKRTRKVGLALFKAEPRTKKRRSRMLLFSGDDGEGKEYGYSHAIPLRISREQPPLYYAGMRMLAVHADSQWKDEAIAYIEEQLQPERMQLPNLLYTDFQPGTYEAWGKAYTYTEGWLRDMDNLEGHFVFAPHRVNETNFSSIKAFMERDMSAEKLAKKLSILKLDPND